MVSIARTRPPPLVHTTGTADTLSMANYLIFAAGLLSLLLHGVRIERYHSPMAAIKQMAWIVATRTAVWSKLGCADLIDLAIDMLIHTA